MEKLGEAGPGGRGGIPGVGGQDGLPLGAALLGDDRAERPDELGRDVDRGDSVESRDRFADRGGVADVRLQRDEAAALAGLGQPGHGVLGRLGGGG